MPDCGDRCTQVAIERRETAVSRFPLSSDHQDGERLTRLLRLRHLPSFQLPSTRAFQTVRLANLAYAARASVVNGVDGLHVRLETETPS